MSRARPDAVRHWNLGTIATPLGNVELVVTSGSPPEDRHSQERTLGEWVPGPEASAILVVATPPLAIGSVAGEPVTRGMGLGTGGVARALVESDPPAMVARSLRARVSPAPDGPAAAEARLTIVAWGLIGLEPSCAVMTSELVVVRRSDGTHIKQLQISAAMSAANVPPAQCASFDHFAADDARLTRVTMADYAHVTAALALEQLWSLR